MHGSVLRIELGGLFEAFDKILIVLTYLFIMLWQRPTHYIVLINYWCSCKVQDQAKWTMLQWPQSLWPGEDLSSLLCKAITFVALDRLLFCIEGQEMGSALVVSGNLEPTKVLGSALGSVLARPEFSALKELLGAGSSRRLAYHFSSLNFPSPVFEVGPSTPDVSVNLCFKAFIKKAVANGLVDKGVFSVKGGRIIYRPKAECKPSPSEVLPEELVLIPIYPVDEGSGKSGMQLPPGLVSNSLVTEAPLGLESLEPMLGSGDLAAENRDLSHGLRYGAVSLCPEGLLCLF